MRAGILFALLTLTAIPPLAAQKSVSEFNGDLVSFVQLVAKSTEKTILYDESMKGRRLSMFNLQYQTPEQLFDIFLTVMEFHSYIVETIGTEGREIYKVKRNIQGPWTATRTLYTEEELAKTQERDDFVTMVIQLEHISAREVQTTLRALRIVNPQGGNLAGIEGSNTLLVTDYAPNVKRIYEVIRLMDRPKRPQPVQKDVKFAIEGQTVTLPTLDTDVVAAFNMRQNATLVVTNEAGQVLAHLDSGGMLLWLSPFLKKNSATLHFKIEVRRSGTSLFDLHVKARRGGGEQKFLELWGVSVDRPLPAGKTIEFVVAFE